MPLLGIPSSAPSDIDGDRFANHWRIWFASLFKAQPFHSSFTLDPASIAANTTAEETVTVVGLTTDMRCFVTKPSHTSGLVVGDAYVSAKDTLKIRLGNVTTGAVNAGSETWTVTAWRA